MDKFVIKGPCKVKGQVNISGSNTGDYKLSGNQPLYYI